MEAKHFNPVKTGLLKGINLIEASAGTGKTYTIAMLVLRFVVEQGISIDALLVVTFTKAATEELKDRIRARLAEAKQALTGNSEGIDPNVIAWLNQLDLDAALIKQRLVLALLDIDQAGIFTIHGFCQRILNEHALESGQLFDSELTADIASIKQACADDFWRKQVYLRSPWEAAVLTAKYKTPEQLLVSVGSVPAGISIFPEASDLDAQLVQLGKAADAAKDSIDAMGRALSARFSEQKFKTSYTEVFDLHWQALSAWVQGISVELPDAAAFNLLTAQGLKEALNGQKFRTTKTQNGETRKNEYLQELALDTAPFDALADSIARTGLVFRRALLTVLHQDIEQRLQKLNVMSFDDLINRLADALQGEKAALLIEVMRQRFKAALIDEFQDTDQRQWFIFASLFASEEQYLYLIGDPKQAIYKFRGADIYSYLAAHKQADHHFTLSQNWRSHPDLVLAINHLFQRKEAFLLESLEYYPVEPGKSAKEGTLLANGQALAPLELWQLSESDKRHWSAGKAAAEIRIAVANEIIRLLTGGYEISNNHGTTPVKPGDIAVLVRTNTQAREYQALLQEAGVPSVLNSTESVFAAQEAADLYVLLQAIAHPGANDFLKQALALDWFGLDGQSFFRTLNQETVLDAWMSRFQNYYQDWQDKGLMVMMLRLFAQENIHLQLSKSVRAERQLTNVYHLIELLQQAVVDEHLGIHKTLDWLRATLAKAVLEKASAEDQQLRLESDAEAVKIVTMHRSKGLEYPIVFCPYLWQRSDRLRSESELIVCHEQGRMVADLGSSEFERRKEQALTEELAEDLRLFYVAVTRAQYRCYLAWADVRSKVKPNQSAFAWLLSFADADFKEQQKALAEFCQKSDLFSYQLLDVPVAPEGHYREQSQQLQLAAKQRKRSLYTFWQMSSYTALSALSQQDEPELPEDKAREPELAEVAVESELPKGSHTGNVVHDLLEHNGFRFLAEGGDISTQREQACLRYGLKLGRPEVINELLQATVQTPLASGDSAFCLMNIPEQNCLKEMPFYLAMQPMNVSKINAVLSDSPVCQPLTARQMSGFLTGFIDLICEYGGRYYVMDYKTNALPDYRAETLLDAMREHNYGLQYWLYTLVLHRYLQQRIPEYQHETHFGGVRYLFVRGMQPEQAMSGVYQDRPALNKIEMLGQLFGSKSLR